MTFMGYRRATSEDSTYVETWRPTTELEDAALPPEEFILGDVHDVEKILRARHPAPRGTFRVQSRGALIYVASHPVLADPVVEALDADPRNEIRAAQKVADAVAAAGGVLVDGRTIEHVRRWRILNKLPVEAAAVPGYPRVTAIIPATGETLQRRAAAAKGVATRAAGTSRAAISKRAQRAAQQTEDARLAAVLSPISAAQSSLRKALQEGFKARCAARGLPRMYLTLDDPSMRLYRLIVGRSHRSLADFKALMKLIDAAGRDREYVLGRCRDWTRCEYTAVTARKGRGPREKSGPPTEEGRPNATKSVKSREVAFAES